MKNKMSNSTPEEMSKTEENSSKTTEHKEEPHSNESDTQQQNAQNVAINPNQIYQPVAPQYAGYIQIQTPTNETIDVGVIPSNTTLSWQADHQIPTYQYINYNYPANYPSLVPVDYINTYTAAPNANNPPYNNPSGANDSQAMSNNSSVEYFSRDKLRANPTTAGYAYQYAPAAANEHIYTTNHHFQHSQPHLADNNNMYTSFNYSYYTKNSHKESSKFRSNPSFKNKNKYSSYNNNNTNNSYVQAESNGFENSLQQQQQQVEQEQKQEQPHKWSDVVKKNKSPLSSSSSTSTANHKNQDETEASTNNNNGVVDFNDGNEAAVKSNKYADNKSYYNPAKPKYNNHKNKSHYYNNNYSFNSYPYSQYGLDATYSDQYYQPAQYQDPLIQQNSINLLAADFSSILQTSAYPTTNATYNKYNNQHKYNQKYNRPNIKYDSPNFYYNGELEGNQSSRFFVIKSYSKEDVIHAIDYGIWCSTEAGNLKLDEAFKQTRDQANGSVYLFFSINSSGQFCGMAEMISNVDYSSDSQIWSQNKWKGKFEISWIYIKNVPNSSLRHILLPNNENKAVTNSRDTQEIPFEQAIQVLNVFRATQSIATILDEPDLDAAQLNYMPDYNKLNKFNPSSKFNNNNKYQSTKTSNDQQLNRKIFTKSDQAKAKAHNSNENNNESIN